jgi:L-ascorbate metabolism protein UlaG (beta-lactamase superfamily)
VNVRWHGQSAFTLESGDTRVTIDPFQDMGAVAGGALNWKYPAIPEHDADLLVITHEHRDHNGADVVTGEPVVIRSVAGTHESPIGEVIAVSSEHDDVAGTKRGPNTIMVFTLDGVRVAHFGDFGQPGMRPEQLAAVGSPDLVFLPVGGGPTIGPEQAAEIVTQLSPRWVVPMHFRTSLIGDFVGPVEPFAELYDRVRWLDSPEFAIEPDGAEGPEIIVPAVPATG